MIGNPSNVDNLYQKHSNNISNPMKNRVDQSKKDDEATFEKLNFHFCLA
jgi:hypothetical protein